MGVFKLDDRSTISEVDDMYRHSMLGKEADIICAIIEKESEIDLCNIVDLLTRNEENIEYRDEVEKEMDSMKKALDRIKLTLTEKQFSKIEDDFNKIVNSIEDIEYLD